MAYTITPVSKTGNINATYDGSPTPTAIVTTTGNAFRNVAVGASFVINSITKTVSSKQSDNQLTMNSTYATDYSGAWTYTNPALTFTTIGALNITKASQPMAMNIPCQDADSSVIMDIDGVARTITFQCDYPNTTANLDIAMDTLDSLVDGQQFLSASIPTFSTDRPSRTYGVYFSSVHYTYEGGIPGNIHVDIQMQERGI